MNIYASFPGEWSVFKFLEMHRQGILFLHKEYTKLKLRSTTFFLKKGSDNLQIQKCIKLRIFNILIFN